MLCIFITSFIIIQIEILCEIYFFAYFFLFICESKEKEIGGKKEKTRNCFLHPSGVGLRENTQLFSTPFGCGIE